MGSLLAKKSWSPYLAGAGIGVLSWFAFATADHPLGITTAFENTAALVERAAVPQLDKTSAYFAARSLAGRPPRIGWEWMLVVGVFLGALVSARLSGDRTRESVPELWRRRFGGSVALRFLAALGGGAVMMFGARMAQGCTSGHGISGALQLAVSSWIFTPVLFVVGIISARILFGPQRSGHV